MTLPKIILTIILAFFISNCFSQSQSDSSFHKIDLRMDLAGQNLQKASSQMIGGTVLMIGGSIIMATSNGNKSPIILGAGCGIIGLGITISGYGKIGLAGRLLSN